MARYNDIFDNFFDDGFFTPATRKVNTMKCDIKETGTHYLLSIELPGFKKEDVSLQLKNGNLTISANAHEDEKEEDPDTRYVRRERYSGSVSRTFYVGEELKQSDIKATFENGELNITIPKEVQHPDEEQYIEIL